MSVLDREVLALMRDVAERIIMPRHRALKATDIIEKADDDLVTIADREAEVALAEGLAKLHPEAAIVGEEAVHADPSVMDRLSGTCWIIDPTDGTANFASGSGHFGIMIALAEGGAAQAGWIYDPQRDRLCAAHLGQGATIDGEQVLVRSRLELEFEMARLGLLQGQAEVFQVSLNAARTLLIREFERSSPAVESATMLIEELLRLEIDPARPDISGSLDLLRSLSDREG